MTDLPGLAVALAAQAGRLVSGYCIRSLEWRTLTH